MESELFRLMLPRLPQLELTLRHYAHGQANFSGCSIAHPRYEGNHSGSGQAMQVAQNAACNCLHQDA